LAQNETYATVTGYPLKKKHYHIYYFKLLVFEWQTSACSYFLLIFPFGLRGYQLHKIDDGRTSHKKAIKGRNVFWMLIEGLHLMASNLKQFSLRTPLWIPLTAPV